MTDGRRIAVVGAGIFGVTCALHLARAGHSVSLFERRTDLMLAASRTNQRRLHRGYHYPRSPQTAAASRRGARSFTEEYADAVTTGRTHYVAVAREGSLVSPEQYLDFCTRMGLEAAEEYPVFLRRDAVAICLRVREAAIDVDRLRRACWRKLNAAGVTVWLRSPRQPADLVDFDRVVVATYAHLNDFEAAGGSLPYQFEVCEKPLLRLPAAYRGTSTVVLDGDFMCIDQAEAHDTFLAGNVRHGVHSTTVGMAPLVPVHLRGFLDRGVVRRPAGSKVAAFLADASRFFTGVEAAEHLGSLFTVRTVLPGLEGTDARPTLVRAVDGRTVAVFSGKISTCVDAAREVVRAVAGDRAPTGDTQQRAVGR